jgi:hypothetical protein
MKLGWDPFTARKYFAPYKLQARKGTLTVGMLLCDVHQAHGLVTAVIIARGTRVVRVRGPDQTRTPARIQKARIRLVPSHPGQEEGCCNSGGLLSFRVVTSAGAYVVPRSFGLRERWQQ